MGSVKDNPTWFVVFLLGGLGNLVSGLIMGISKVTIWTIGVKNLL